MAFMIALDSCAEPKDSATGGFFSSREARSLNRAPHTIRLTDSACDRHDDLLKTPSSVREGRAGAGRDYIIPAAPFAVRFCYTCTSRASHSHFRRTGGGA